MNKSLDEHDDELNRISYASVLADLAKVEADIQSGIDIGWERKRDPLAIVAGVWIGVIEERCGQLCGEFPALEKDLQSLSIVSSQFARQTADEPTLRRCKQIVDREFAGEAELKMAVRSAGGILMSDSKAAANHGNAAAQFRLALCYELGVGVRRRDTANAISWMRKAANGGDSEAAYALGHLLCDESEIPKLVPDEALEWWCRAAREGHADAQFALGQAYVQGRATGKHDHGKAFSLFQQSAAQGKLEAQYNLAVCYATGYGVQQDLAKAMEYYQLSKDVLAFLEGDEVTLGRRRVWEKYFNASSSTSKLGKIEWANPSTFNWEFCVSREELFGRSRNRS